MVLIQQTQTQQQQQQPKPQTPVVIHTLNPQLNQLLPEHRIPVYYFPSRSLTSDTMDVNKMYIVPNPYDMLPRGQPQNIEVYPGTENTTVNSF